MPPWITSLLREETPLPIPPVRSATMTPWPRMASARAIANPTTPAPMTRTSMVPFRTANGGPPGRRGFLAKRRLGRDRRLRRGGADVRVHVVLEALEILVEHVDETLGRLREGRLVLPGFHRVEDVRL